MKVDITGSDYQNLIGFIQKFPSGRIIVEEGKAFWEFNDTQQIQPILPPQNQQYAPQPTLNQARGVNQPQPQKKNAFLNMFDTMASYF
ncbi:MAG: hypothetical protein ACTSQG_05250 [Promethearchaeota archaeon]